MVNNEDYRLEDAEDAAMKKSQMAKRVILGGAALGAVGVTAYAANEHFSHGEAPAAPANIEGGSEAGAINDDVLDPEPAPAPAPVVNNHYHVHIHEEAAPEHDADVQFNDSTMIIDSDTGEYIGGYDEGTIDGKSFTIVDNSGDGIADVMAYDANGNGVYEDNEIQLLDDGTVIPIGNAKNVAVITTDEIYGESDPSNDYNPDSQNDLAYQNPDYNNNVEYAAEYEGEPVVEDTAYVEEYEEPLDNSLADAQTDIMPDDTVDTVDFV